MLGTEKHILKFDNSVHWTVQVKLLTHLKLIIVADQHFQYSLNCRFVNAVKIMFYAIRICRADSLLIPTDSNKALRPSLIFDKCEPSDDIYCTENEPVSQKIRQFWQAWSNFDNFSIQHHTFKNDVHIQLYLFLHFCLRYWLLNNVMNWQKANMHHVVN